VALANYSRMPSTFFRSSVGKEGEFVIAGKEIVGEVSCPSNQSGIGTISTLALLINESISPANQALFPRLSAIAQTFEQYHFRKLRFHYVTSCAATTDGALMHYVDYDVFDTPASSALEILANQTATVGSVASSSTVDFRTEKQMLRKMFMNVPGSVDSSQGSPPSGISLRENYVGWYRLYIDKAVALQFVGYAYVEYEVCLYTPKAADPIAGAGTWSNASPTVSLIPPGGSYSPFYCVKRPSAGLNGGPNEHGGEAANTVYGSIQGLVDFGKQIYHAGQWLIGLRAWMAAATPPVSASGKASGVPKLDLTRAILGRSTNRRPSIESEYSYVPNVFEHKEERKSFQSDDPAISWEGSLHSCYDLSPEEYRDRQLRAPLVSGDVRLTLEAYDVTNGYVNPDFPRLAGNMTLVSSAYNDYTGSTGALVGELTWKNTVPPGKRYIYRAIISVGDTTQRIINSSDMFAHLFQDLMP